MDKKVTSVRFNNEVSDLYVYEDESDRNMSCIEIAGCVFCCTREELCDIGETIRTFAAGEIE